MNFARWPHFVALLFWVCLSTHKPLHAQLSLVLQNNQQIELLHLKNNLLRFLLLGIGEDDQTKLALIEEARDYIRLELSAGVDLDIIKIDSWDLESDIRYLRANILTKKAALGLDSQSLGKHPLDSQMMIIFDQFFINGNSRADQLRAYNQFEHYFENQLGRIKNLGEELSQSPDFKLSSPGHEAFIKRFLNFYFQHLSDESLKNIALDLMLSDKTLSTHEAMAIILKNSGPGLGKLLQSLGKDPNLGESLTELIEVLESNNKSVPHYLFLETVNSDPAGHVLASIAPKPLGTGTMAQVNKALMKNGETVAVRILKPGIEKKAQGDIVILKNFLLPGPHLDQIPDDLLSSLRKMIDPLAVFLLTELDIKKTKEKQIKAVEIYDRTVQVEVDNQPIKVEIHVPRLIDQTPDSQIMIQEFVSASTKFGQLENTSSQRAISRVLNQVWFSEAIMESGFIHADLHQGNFSVEQLSDHFYRINLFDLGMAETLNTDLRRAFVLIGSGVKFEDAALIARGFSILNPDKPLAQIKNLVREQMTKASLTSEEWVMWGMRNELIVSEQLGSLARGSNLVYQLSKSMGIEEETITSRSLIRTLAYNVAKKMFSFSGKSTLSSGDLWAITTSASGKSCMDLLNSLRGKKLP